jgi:hypothetical protein
MYLGLHLSAIKAELSKIILLYNFARWFLGRSPQYVYFLSLLFIFKEYEGAVLLPSWCISLAFIFVIFNTVLVEYAQYFLSPALPLWQITTHSHCLRSADLNITGSCLQASLEALYSIVD